MSSPSAFGPVIVLLSASLSNWDGCYGVVRRLAVHLRQPYRPIVVASRFHAVVVVIAGEAGVALAAPG